AIEPIPEQIEHDLLGTSRGVIHGDPEARARPDVVPLAERDLHFRHDIPVGFLTADKFSIGEEFDHGGPLAAKAPPLAEGFACHRSPEHGSRGVIGVRRQLDSALELQEAVLRQQLSIRSESLEDRDSGAHPSGLIASRQDDLALDAEDGARPDTGEQQTLKSEPEVAYAAE